MNTETLVYIDLNGVPYLVGRLRTVISKGRESATFDYDPAWLDDPIRFSLEPAFRLDPIPINTLLRKPLLGAVGDSAPDSWGRNLLRRAERLRTRAAGETPRTVREIEHLLMVDDVSRQGALRFAAGPRGPFLAPSTKDSSPPLTQIPRLLKAVERVINDAEREDDLHILLTSSASLGGARPKASIRDADGQLAIAKFSHKNDRRDVVRWEAVALKLAELAGVPVAPWCVKTVAGKPVLVVRRFDRNGKVRVPFISAMSMLAAGADESRSYLEFVDALRLHGAAARQDMRLLWRRIVFMVLISSTDDHLRNHGFLYEGPRGWRLAPAYDLNPVPEHVRPRILSTAIDLDESTASLDLALSVAGYFELPPDEARRIAAEVGRAVAEWRNVAASLGLSATEIRRMAPAFEHADLSAANAPK